MRYFSGWFFCNCLTAVFVQSMPYISCPPPNGGCAALIHPTTPPSVILRVVAVSARSQHPRSLSCCAKSQHLRSRSIHRQRLLKHYQITLFALRIKYFSYPPSPLSITLRIATALHVTVVGAVDEIRNYQITLLNSHTDIPHRTPLPMSSCAERSGVAGSTKPHRPTV